MLPANTLCPPNFNWGKNIQYTCHQQIQRVNTALPRISTDLQKNLQTYWKKVIVLKTSSLFNCFPLTRIPFFVFFYSGAATRDEKCNAKEEIHGRGDESRRRGDGRDKTRRSAQEENDSNHQLWLLAAAAEELRTQEECSVVFTEERKVGKGVILVIVKLNQDLKMAPKSNLKLN